MNESGHDQFIETWASPKGFPGWLSEVNNRPLGVRFMVTASVFFVFGGILALLMRIQLAVSENDFMGPELYNQLFTMHGSTMMYLFSVPFLEGLALYVLPLMIGSRDVAYPRLTAFGYWTYLFGGIIFYSSFLVGEAPDGGWFASSPLSSTKYSGLGLDFWALGLSLVEISGIVAGVEIVVTILMMRAPGMTMARMPVFAWAMLAAGLMSLFAFTTLLVATLMLELDRAAGTQFFNAEHGGTSLLWQHLFWFFGHPEVYIIFLPATGIVSMVVATAAKRLRGYTYIAVAIFVTAFVSFGLWVHHMYTTGLPELSLGFFAAASLMIALASGVQVFAWIATLWGTRPKLNAAVMYVLGFVFIFVLGGMTGVMVAVVPFDWQVHDTYFVVAHLHYVLIGGAVFPMMAGLYYWIPKFTGRMLSPFLGHLGFWFAFIGFNVTFFPMHIMGFFGMPRRVYTYPSLLEIDSYNAISTVGAFVFGASYIIFLADLLLSFRKGLTAGDNPWGGDTLEWSVSSPPPSYAFLKPPCVHSRHPLWNKVNDEGALEMQGANRDHVAICQELSGQPALWRATINTDMVFANPQSIQYLPGPSYYPLIVATGLAISFLAILMKVHLVALVGVSISALALGQWMAPNRDTIALLLSHDIAKKTDLPIIAPGRKSVIWGAMVCTIAILATILVALLYSYFYIRLYSPQWPQLGLTKPDWGIFIVVYGLLALSAPSMFLAIRCFQSGKRLVTQLLMSGTQILLIAFMATSMFALWDYGISPRASAYGSLVYLLTGFPLILSVIVLPMVANAQLNAWNEPDARSPFMELHFQVSSSLLYFLVVAGISIFVTLTMF